MNIYRKMLIALTDSLEPLNEGLRIARDENHLVTVLQVVPPYEGDLDLTGVRNIREVLDSGRDESARAIKSIIDQEGSFARVRVEAGDITETINRVASEEACDLIIMGAHKSGGLLRRFLDGNVIKKVTSRAPCPVLVVEA